MITVYHGSTVAIPHPLVKLGREGLDFGVGFYVTDIQQQAERWAQRVSRQRREPAVLNVYQFDVEKAKTLYRYLTFAHYDLAWLNFVAESRSGKKPWSDYDCIEGGVANDRVIDTVESYMSGNIDAAHALRELSQHQPNNQFCLLNQALVDECLCFTEVIK